MPIFDASGLMREARKLLRCNDFGGQGRGRTADLPIFSRPGPILVSHKGIGNQQLLDLRRLTRTTVNRQVRAEFRADWSSAREHESDTASDAGLDP
jgi:hypothetical protein